MMSEINDLISDTTHRIFQDLAAPQAIINMATSDWRQPLWSALEEVGLTTALAPETLGGSGIPLTGALNIARVAGAHAVAVPLIETLLGGWLLGEAGIAAPSGPLTLAPSQWQGQFISGADGRISGSATRVPFAGDVDHYVVYSEDEKGNAHAVLLSGDSVSIERGTSIAGDAMGTLTAKSVVPVEAGPVESLSRDSLMQFGAIARAMQMSGGLEALLEMSVQYAGERAAFGRTISKYQAVQHNLARMAGEAAAAVAISTSAAYALENRNSFDEAVFLEAASAKIRAGEAAGEGAAIAHQVHGAIGYTGEHPLHRFAQRLWAWRDDFGNEVEWAEKLGRHYAAKGGSAMWPTVTAA